MIRVSKWSKVYLLSTFCRTSWLSHLTGWNVSSLICPGITQILCPYYFGRLFLGPQLHGVQGHVLFTGVYIRSKEWCTLPLLSPSDTADLNGWTFMCIGIRYNSNVYSRSLSLVADILSALFLQSMASVKDMHTKRSRGFSLSMHSEITFAIGSCLQWICAASLQP